MGYSAMGSMVTTVLQDMAKSQVEAFEERCHVIIAQDGGGGAVHNPPTTPSSIPGASHAKPTLAVPAPPRPPAHPAHHGREVAAIARAVDHLCAAHTSHREARAGTAEEEPRVEFGLKNFTQVCTALRSDFPGFEKLCEWPALRTAVFSALVALRRGTIPAKGGGEREEQGEYPVAETTHVVPLWHLAQCIYVLIEAAPEHRVRGLFDLMDVDHDGLLTRRELQDALSNHMRAVATAVREIVRYRWEHGGGQRGQDSIVGGAMGDAGSERALRAIDRVVREVEIEIPDAVDQIFHDVGAEVSETISYEAWQLEWKQHPELLEMMSVRSIGSLAEWVCDDEGGAEDDGGDSRGGSGDGGSGGGSMGRIEGVGPSSGGQNGNAGARR